MTTSSAFKEWAAVCRALGAGRQIVILRKGGIVEAGGEFKPDHTEFLLLPTYLHQNSASLKPTDRDFLEASLLERPTTDHFVTDLYSVVSHVEWVRSIAALDRVRATHVWSDEVIRERFRRWEDESVWALVVRVWRLPQPVAIPNLPEYQGCKSWVDLREPISVVGAVPILSEEEFGRQQLDITSSLKSANPDQ